MIIVSVGKAANWSWTLTNKCIFEHLHHTVYIQNGSTHEIPKEKPDLILLQHVNDYNIFKNDAPVIGRLGGSRPFHNNIHRFDNKIKSCFAIIATNQHLYELAKELNPNTHLIPNCLNLEVWKNIYTPQKFFTVGFCANIVTPEYQDQKGYGIIMEACRQMGVHVHQALYKINQIEHTNMIRDFYSKIDVLVHPTLTEGCSNCLTESLSVGVPIITTKTAGYHGELLQNNLNVLFCERTVESIIETVSKLRATRNLSKKLSKAGRVFAETHHDVNVIAEQYNKIFWDCYNKNKVEPLLPPPVVKEYKIEKLKIESIPEKEKVIIPYKRFTLPQYRPKR